METVAISTSVLTLEGYQEYQLLKNENVPKTKSWIIYISHPERQNNLQKLLLKKSNVNVTLWFSNRKRVYQSSGLVELQLFYSLNRSSLTTCHPGSRVLIKNAWLSQASWIINISPQYFQLGQHHRNHKYSC